MPGLMNPNTPLRVTNPYSPTKNLFDSGIRPQSYGGEGEDGLVAPQAGAAPSNTAPLVTNHFGDEIGQLLGGLPSPVLPYVPPPTAGQVDELTAMQQLFGQNALPLISQLLGLQQGQYGIVESMFGPEMALRQGLLDVIGGQNNSLLQQLLGLQDQMARPAESGTFFFTGF